MPFGTVFSCKKIIICRKHMILHTETEFFTNNTFYWNRIFFETLFCRRPIKYTVLDLTFSNRFSFFFITLNFDVKSLLSTTSNTKTTQLVYFLLNRKFVREKFFFGCIELLNKSRAPRFFSV